MYVIISISHVIITLSLYTLMYPPGTIYILHERHWKSEDNIGNRSSLLSRSITDLLTTTLLWQLMTQSVHTAHAHNLSTKVATKYGVIKLIFVQQCKPCPNKWSRLKRMWSVECKIFVIPGLIFNGHIHIDFHFLSALFCKYNIIQYSYMIMIQCFLLLPYATLCTYVFS